MGVGKNLNDYSRRYFLLLNAYQLLRYTIFLHSAYQAKQISQTILQEIEEIAQEKGCCKITLEVLEGNNFAKKAYKKFGFKGYKLDPTLDSALFWEKTLNT